MYNPNKDFALEIENQIDRNPVLPIGDRYIGTLVNATTIGYAIYSMRFFHLLNFKTAYEQLDEHLYGLQD